MRPVARGAEVLLTSIEADGEHRLTNTSPDVVGLVLALGHERLLGCCQSYARREDEGAEHRPLTHARAARAVLTLVAATQSRTGEIDASPRWRAAHSVGGQPLLGDHGSHASTAWSRDLGEADRSVLRQPLAVYLLSPPGA